MHNFKIGDQVRKKDGTPFGDGNLINTIREPDKDANDWLKGNPWVKKGWVGADHIELVPDNKFYVSKTVTALERGYVTTNCPSGTAFTSSGGTEVVTILSHGGRIEMNNEDIPTIINHLQQWYDAVQLEKESSQ